MRSTMVKAIFLSGWLLPFKQYCHSPPVYFAYPFTINSTCWCFKSMVICLFLPRLCYPQISLCPFCHSAVRGGWGSPSGGEQSGVGGGRACTPFHTCIKCPIPSGLPCFSSCFLFKPLGWSCCLVRSEPSSPSIRAPLSFQGLLNQATLPDTFSSGA